MDVSKVSGYLHAYEAYRVPAPSKDSTDTAQEDQKEEGRLVLMEKSQEQMKEDRQNYSAMLHIKEINQASKQAQDNLEKEIKNQAKVMTIYRRICKGDIVPQFDEKKLMEYDQKLYMAAKQAQAMAQREDRKKHDSLWKEKEKPDQPAEPIDWNKEMGEFADAQAKSVVEVPAPQAETAQTVSLDGLSGAVFDTSI